MSLKVAIQMDPVEGINIETDTTFFLMLEAQARGHALWVYTPERIAMEGSRVTARGRALNLQAVKGKLITVSHKMCFLFQICTSYRDADLSEEYITRSCKCQLQINEAMAAARFACAKGVHSRFRRAINRQSRIKGGRS